MRTVGVVSTIRDKKFWIKRNEAVLRDVTVGNTRKKGRKFCGWGEQFLLDT